ncbi:hypothetical protein [Dactylosporangium matsuzakiense]|nr:hypothetical protein [Dactylosporangium matsuzakiense]UWZ43135.1 hypothetical protein Dmats_37445 [Dactylosporangium matsuzakiense]
MNSTTITIGLVVVALAVGGWILLRGGREDEEELEAETPAPAPTPAAPATAAPVAAAAAAPAAPRAPTPAAPMSAMPAMGMTGMPGMAGPTGMTGMAGMTGMTGMTSDAHAYEVRTRWQDLQLRFVDDPQSAAGEAERLVDDALAGVTASLNARKDQLSTWRASGRDDTEQLRAAVHGYRDFLNHLVGA